MQQNISGVNKAINVFYILMVNATAATGQVTV